MAVVGGAVGSVAAPSVTNSGAGITDAILGRLDPDGALAATYHRYDPDPPVMP